MEIFDPSKKPNFTPAARHIATSKPRTERRILPPMPTSKYERPMARLSFGVLTAKESRSIQELYGLITRGPLNAKYIFPDTGFLTTSIPKQFWGVASQRLLAFSELTVGELSGWLGNPVNNQDLHSWLARGIERCKSSHDLGRPFRWSNALGLINRKLLPCRVGIQDRNEMSAFGYDYYVNLLSIRKRLGIRVAKAMELDLGRSPTDAELRDKLFREYDQRGAPIAFKGWQDCGKRNFSADEELVVSAAINAIMTGETTLILTRDTDVFEQFVKLMEMLSSDYLCYRFGCVRNSNPSGVPMYPIPVESLEAFDSENIECVVTSFEEAHALPTYNHTPVHCFCVLVGNSSLDPKISIAGFCLETEMAPLLFTKADFGGRNSPFFGSRNVVGGTRLDEGVQIMFAIGEERYEDFEGVTASWTDIQQTLRSKPPIISNVW